MSVNLKGTGVAIVTPFKENKELDLEALKKLVNHIIENGVEYIVVLGTTGESVTLNKEEKVKVTRTVVETNKERVPLVLGIGGNNTAEVIRLMSETDLTGISAILSVSPYYNKPTQEGIYQHYKALNAATPLPIILYNVPARTGSNVLPATVLRIANECKNVIAVKEASGDVTQSMEIIMNRPEGFFVLSGDDAITLPLMACGADGVISVVANAYPRQFSDMVREAGRSEFESAREKHYSLLEIIDNLFVEGNPGGVKASLKIMGITGDDVRLPLVKVSEKTYKKLESLNKTL